MRNMVLIALLLASCGSGKIDSGRKDTSKLLLTEEIQLCTTCQAIRTDDTIKITKYVYDDKNRLVNREIDDRTREVNNLKDRDISSEKFIYDENNNLIQSIRTEGGTTDTTDFYYVKKIPAYSTRHGSRKPESIFTVTGHKITMETRTSNSATWVYTYRGNNTITHAMLDSGKLIISDTTNYGTKRNPLSGCNLKWENLMFNLPNADNEIVQRVIYSSGLEAHAAVKFYSIEKLVSVYNDQGYPLESKDRIGGITYYTYIRAK